MAVVIMWAIVTIPTVIWKANTRVKVFKQIKKEVIFTAVMLVIWLGLSIFLVIALKQTCICVFNDNYGVRVNKNFYFST